MECRAKQCIAGQSIAKLVTSQGQRATVGPTGAARSRADSRVRQGKAVHRIAMFVFSQWLRGNSQPQPRRQRHEWSAGQSTAWHRIAMHGRASFTTALANLAGANGAGSAERIVKDGRAKQGKAAHGLYLIGAGNRPCTNRGQARMTIWSYSCGNTY